MIALDIMDTSASAAPIIQVDRIPVYARNARQINSNTCFCSS